MDPTELKPKPDSKSRNYDEDELFSTANNVSEGDSHLFRYVVYFILTILVLAFVRALFK